MVNEERLRKEREVFEACLSKAPDEWPTFLREVCAGDDALRKRVGRLLAAHQRADHSTHSTHSKFAQPDSHQEQPESIGPYRVLSRLGRGGMGVVYKAEQTRPVRRVVAVKLIKKGMDTREVIARFESERQALALMNHPNVARILDAGSTQAGRPYFVMEYVPGEPITRYCDLHRLSVRERIELFHQVCGAVQHAHQKGIIHRDLKPSNVLVSVQEGTPSPKIIDFGVAKATEFRLTEKTLNTSLGMLVGTPEYMSPEQAEMSRLDIDTRTDVYSLGAMLYELLTGTRPFDSATLAFAEVSCIIREVDPPLPSQRAVSHDGAERTAHNRHSDPKGLSRKLAGDLDWIVMKALEKDRTRRYASANEIGADLRRHLAMEPVSAGPPSASYRLSKFARRHRGTLAASLLLLLVLVGGIIGTSIGLLRARSQAQRARLQADIAEAVNDYLTQDILSAVDPAQQGIDVTMREVLEKASQQVAHRFADQPLVEASVRGAIGRTYSALGEFPQAEAHLRKAIDLLQGNEASDHSAVIAAVNDLVATLHSQSKLNEAMPLARQSLEGGRKALGEDHHETLLAAYWVALILARQRRYEEAGSMLRDMLERRRRLWGEEDATTIDTMVALGNLSWYQRDFSKASDWYRRCLDASNKAFGPDHPTTLLVLNNLGYSQSKVGQLEEAEDLLAETLESRRRVLGPDHFRTLATMAALADVQFRLDKDAEALQLYQESYEKRRDLLGPDNPDTLVNLYNLALALDDVGRLEEAEKLFLETLERRKRVLGSDHWRTSKTQMSLGNLFVNQGRWQEAEPLYSEALPNLREKLGEGHLDTVIASIHVARLHNLRGRHQQARTLAESALTAAKLHVSEAWRLEMIRIELGISSTALREYELAEQALLQAQRTLEARWGESSTTTQSAVRALVDLYAAKGDADSKALWASRLSSR